MFGLFWVVSGSLEVVYAFGVREQIDERADSVPEGWDCSLGPCAQRLELGEGVLDGVEVGTVGRQVGRLAPAASIASRTPAAFVAGRLSITTTSPGPRVGTSTWLT
jgi:hypothetical protein